MYVSSILTRFPPLCCVLSGPDVGQNRYKCPSHNGLTSFRPLR
jgi:hypothetical protein